jgi:hypothetical protein
MAWGTIPDVNGTTTFIEKRPARWAALLRWGHCIVQPAPLWSPSARGAKPNSQAANHQTFDPMCSLHGPHSQVAGEIRPDHKCNDCNDSDCDSGVNVDHRHACHLVETALPK